MKTSFNAAVFAAFALSCKIALAVEFTAEVDKSEIAQDEAVSLKLNLTSDKVSQNVGTPEFDAPDFTVINSYPSVYVESLFVNGKFSVRNRQIVTVVLRPRKTGSLSIRNIRVKVGDTSYSAGPITVQVLPAGQGSPPPRYYGGGSGNGGLRGAAKRQDGRLFFIRVQLNKERVYKGEQLIVSYYLYRKARVFNMNVTQYPVLSGFLREDLEIPIMTGNFTPESVIVDGTSYERQLLARYAAYPLKEGKLPIDTMTLKADVLMQPSLSDDPFENMFRSMTPQTMTQRSENVSIEVLPLPNDGKPKDYSGLVGDFEIHGAVDRVKLKSGEPITFTVRVQGRANFSSLETPEITLPKGVEMFESKGAGRSGQGAVNEKTFEYILIPRYGGTFLIPSVSISSFDPEKKAYIARNTSPIALEVEGPEMPPQLSSTSNDIDPARQPSPVGTTVVPSAAEPTLGSLKGVSSSQWTDRAQSILKWVFVLLGASLLAAWLARRVRTWKHARDVKRFKNWDTRYAHFESKLNRSIDARSAETPSLIESFVFDELSRKFEMSARSYARSDLKRILVDERQVVKNEDWQKIADTLAELDSMRFSGSSSESLPNEAIQRVRTKLLEAIPVLRS